MSSAPTGLDLATRSWRVGSEPGISGGSGTATERVRPTLASDWASLNNKTYSEIEEHLTIVPSFIFIFSFWLLASLPEMRDSLGFIWMEGPDPLSCYLEKWPCCFGMSDLPHELFITPSRAESGVSCARPEGMDGRMLLSASSVTRWGVCPLLNIRAGQRRLWAPAWLAGRALGAPPQEAWFPWDCNTERQRRGTLHRWCPCAQPPPQAPQPSEPLWIPDRWATKYTEAKSGLIVNAAIDNCNKISTNNLITYHSTSYKKSKHNKQGELVKGTLSCMVMDGN